MNILAVCACTMGVAHTYIAKDKLMEAAQRLGHTIKCETQGSVGTECKITATDVKHADIVIVAADINVSGLDRFQGKPIVKVGVSVAIKQPEQLIHKIELKLKEKKQNE